MSTKILQIVDSITPQSDWSQSDITAADYIKNKPTDLAKKSESLQKSGDTMAGPLCLTEDVNFGADVPDTLQTNELFFYKKNFLEFVYPVGSIYISATSVNPSVLFGCGSWIQIEDKLLISAGSKYNAGEVGNGEVAFNDTTDSNYPYLVVYMWKRIE